MNTTETAGTASSTPNAVPGTVLAIDGMSCGSCVAHVTRALAAVPGISTRTVSIGRAEIVPASEGSLAAALVALASAGYAARVAGTLPVSSAIGSARAGGCCGGGSGAGGSCCG